MSEELEVTVEDEPEQKLLDTLAKALITAAISVGVKILVEKGYDSVRNRGSDDTEEDNVEEDQ